MRSHTDHQQLQQLADEMADELQCYLLDTEGDGPATQRTRELLKRYRRRRFRLVIVEQQEARP